MFRRLEADGFNFSVPHNIDFNIDFDAWPPSPELIKLLRQQYPNLKVFEPDGKGKGYVLFVIEQLTYELVMFVQSSVSELAAPFGGVCESWGVMHEAQQAFRADAEDNAPCFLLPRWRRGSKATLYGDRYVSIPATYGGGNKNKARLWLSPLLVGGVGGLIVGGLMMLAAWEHNPQGAIHNEHGIEWRYWLLIGASWFLPVFVVLGLVWHLVVRLTKSQ